MADQARAVPPQTDPRFGFIQQQLAAQDKVMAQMAAGIQEIQKAVSESATQAARSADHRERMQKDLDELKTMFRAYMGHSHPQLADLSKTVGDHETRLADHEGRLTRDETIGRVALIVITVILAPILLLIVGAVITLVVQLLVTGHIP